MSYAKCRTIGCPHTIREGLRRSGTAGDGSELADGMFCWRCRRKQREPKRVSRRPPEIEARDRSREAADAVAADPSLDDDAPDDPTMRQIRAATSRFYAGSDRPRRPRRAE